MDRNTIDELRATRVQLGKVRHKEFDIPGYDGKLVVRCHTIEWDETKKIAERLDKSTHPRKELHAQIDTIIAATDEIMTRSSEGLVSLSDNGDGSVKWDRTLATFFDIDSDNARVILSEVFNNDLAISGFHNQLFVWLQDASANDDEDFAGKSEGTRLSSLPDAPTP